MKENNHGGNDAIKETDLKKLFENVDSLTGEFVDILSSFDQEEINTIPFEGSWTAAQLADHITKSNRGIAQALEMPGRKAERKADERVKELKEVFLNFETKLKSPEFVLPAQTNYEKEAVLISLKRSIDKLKEERTKVDLQQIIDLTALGTISKLELLYFVTYHTQRHVRQLKKIFQTIKNENIWRR